MSAPARQSKESGGTGDVPVPPGSRSRWIAGSLVVKVLLLAILDAFGVFVALTLAGRGLDWQATACAAVLLLVNWTYLRAGGLPAKYLTPGLALLLVFQIFVVVYTMFIATTNYGDGHNITRGEAIRTIVANSFAPVPGSTSYRVRVLERNGLLALLAVDAKGDALLGDTTTPLAPVESVTRDGQGEVSGVRGWRTLPLRDLLARQDEVVGLSVPVSADLSDGALRTADGRTGTVFRGTKTFDETRNAIVDSRTHTAYDDNGRGAFSAPDGRRLEPGWRAGVGLSNFRAAIGANLNGPLLGVLAWTLSYAVLSVVLSFALGTFLALALNDPRLRFRRLYRALIILPYAFPIFLSGLVWSGLLNPEFGFVNQVLLGGADVQWLQDPWLARVSVVLVSTWFGFPYFFLVSTGALQTIGLDVQQAAVIDGASSWQLFRFVRLPLLLVATSPLLIAAFAYSFNDFNTIFMLTNGGPIDTGSSAGATDILITVVYKQAFVGSSRDYGLASAYAVVIFGIVSVIAVLLFRSTRSLEQVA